MGIGIGAVVDKIKDDRSTTSNQFADRLAEALQTRKLSLNRVRAHLKAMGHDVSVASLSYWSTGRPWRKYCRWNPASWWMRCAPASPNSALTTS